MIWRRNEETKQLALCWSDKKVVCMLSTIHKADMIDAKINYRGEIVVKPTCVADYNKYMLGVDLSDQLSVYYAYDRRTRKWSRKMIYFLFERLVCNAYILYKKDFDKRIEHLSEDAQKSARRNKLTHRQFQEAIAVYLMYGSSQNEPLNASNRSTYRSTEPCLTERHFPTVITSDKVTKRKTASRRCHVCKVLAETHPGTMKQHYSSFECKDCSKTLCLGVRNCFMKYHCEENFAETARLLTECERPENETDGTNDSTDLGRVQAFLDSLP